jgi:hypothetical protein
MIYDLDGNPITSTSLNIEAGDEHLFSVLVDCKPGYALTGTDAGNPDISMFARADPGDSWTDIIAGSLDTEPFAPTRKQFYFKIAIAGGADDATQIVQVVDALPA